MKVVVAGGSGALGRRLCPMLAARGHEVVVLTRSASTKSASTGPSSGWAGDLGCRSVRWDGRTVGPWASELEGAAVVNLAGALVDRRPTPANTALLTDSRVEPTRALAEAAATLDDLVPVWVQASTLAIYGDAGDTVLTETSPLADGPPQMAGVARAWEAAAQGVRAQRQVVLRTGIVLDAGTPALDRLLLLTRLGLGGRLGSGRQWISWIHVQDWLAIVADALADPALADPALADPALAGVVFATGPSPVRNADLMRSLRRVAGRPPAPPTPVPLVHLGAFALRSDPALGLTGRRALPARLVAAGFRFTFTDLDAALDDLVNPHG